MKKHIKKKEKWKINMPHPLFPKDERITKLLERLVKDRATETSYELAKQLSRYKEIRNIRSKEKLYIGMDRKMGKSIIYFKKPIKKKGNGFIL